jgi:hypothetical protein
MFAPIVFVLAFDVTTALLIVVVITALLFFSVTVTGTFSVPAPVIDSKISFVCSSKGYTLSNWYV